MKGFIEVTDIQGYIWCINIINIIVIELDGSITIPHYGNIRMKQDYEQIKELIKQA